MAMDRADALSDGAAAPPGEAARPFVGRERETVELRANLEAAPAGRAGLMLITGEPGIGKTRLMDEFGRLAAGRGWRVLTGRCWDAGGAPAYWPWIQVVRAAGGDFERLSPRHPPRGGLPGAPRSADRSRTSRSSSAR